MGKVTKKNLVNYIMEYEEGSLGANETMDLFSHLIKTGQAWQLQGSIYGRPAVRLIEEGFISPDGKILKRYDDVTDSWVLIGKVKAKRKPSIRRMS